MGEFMDACGRAASRTAVVLHSCTSGSLGTLWPGPSYALIVMDTYEELTYAEVKRRLIESMSRDMNVRMKSSLLKGDDSSSRSRVTVNERLSYIDTASLTRGNELRN